jgi:hypothetical protein
VGTFDGLTAAGDLRAGVLVILVGLGGGGLPIKAFFERTEVRVG